MADRRLRILILNWKDLAHPAAGGAEVYTEGFARELAARGHEVTLFASAVEGRPADEVVAGVRVVRRGGRLTVYREAARYWQHEADGTVDVVLDEVNTRPFFAPRFVRSVPVVALIHQVAREVWRYETPWPVAVAGRHVFEPRWLRRYRGVRVLTDSPSSAESLREYGIEGAHPLPIGAAPIDVPDVAKAERPTVVFLARLVPSKRPDHVIDAFERLRSELPDAELWMVGDGPWRERLAARRVPGVTITGHVPFEERTLRLARAHVLAAASVREGWGLNVSEAAAVGTPSIGYRVPGLVDSVPASGGLLVDPDPASLAAGLSAFFRGDVTLRPTSTLVPWSVVADAVQQHLLEAVDARSA